MKLSVPRGRNGRASAVAQTASSPIGCTLGGAAGSVRRWRAGIAVIGRIGAGVVECVERRQRRDVGCHEAEIGPAVGGGIPPGERHQCRILFDPEPPHAGHAGGQAEQCRARAAAALEDAGTRPRRDGGRQQHRLDAAAESAPGLGISHAAIEEMAIGLVASVRHVCGQSDGLPRKFNVPNGAPELFRGAILA